MVSSIGSSLTSALFSSSSAQSKQQSFFKKADTDGDGKISLAEFTAAGPQSGDATQDAANAKQIFSQIDTDGDGSISSDELAAAKPPQGSPQGPPPGPPPSGKLSGGNVLQLNSDDSTTLSDSSTSATDKALKALLDLLSGSSDSTATSGTASTDGTSTDSAASTASSDDSDTDTLLSYLDTNGDGSVSKDEAKTGFSNMRSEMMHLLLSYQNGQGTSTSAAAA